MQNLCETQPFTAFYSCVMLTELSSADSLFHQKVVSLCPHLCRAFVHQSAATMHLPADIGRTCITDINICT